jgi:hypothetical protein
MPDVGDLIRTTAGTWITRPPACCSNGQDLGTDRLLVGHEACLGHGLGQTTWMCRACGVIVYGPPKGSHCAALDGPASVRISNITASSSEKPVWG